MKARKRIAGLHLGRGGCRGWICVAIMVCVYGNPLARAQTRVALVSTCDREAVGNAMALAEAELSQSNGLALVDRTEIEKVLGEQQQCELFDGRRAVAVGRLLNAQIFAVVENYTSDHQAVALVAFDAVTGVRLWDTVLPSDNAQRTADGIVFGVWMAAEKYFASKNELKTVCLLAVRNVDLPLENDSVCQSVGTLVERQLLSSERIAVLERKRLELVNEERSLPSDTIAGDLFPSLIAMDLEMSRANPRGGIRASVTFSDAQEKKLGSVTAAVDGDDPAQLAEALVQQIAQFLHVTAVSPLGDRQKEANRFLSEAQFLSGHKDAWGALYAVESAHALHPTDLITRGRLARFLTDAATDLLLRRRLPSSSARYETQTNEAAMTIKRSLRMAGRALEIDAALRRQRATIIEGDADGFTDSIQSSERLLTFYVRRNVRPRLREFDADDQQTLAALKAGLRNVLVNLVATPAATHVKDVDTFYGFANVVGSLQVDLEDLCPSSREWTSDMLKVLQLYLDLAERFGARSEWQLMNNRVLLQISCQAGGRSAEEREKFLAMLQRMESHSDTLVQIYGKIGRLHLERQDGGLSSEEILRRYGEIKKFIREKIAHPERAPARLYRVLTYLAAMDAIDLFADRADRQHEYQDLFEFMLERKEIEVMTARRAMKPDSSTFEEYGRYYSGLQGCSVERNTVAPDDYLRLLRNCDRVIALTQSPDSYDLSGPFFAWEAGSAEAEFLQQRRSLLGLMPELAPKQEPPWSKTQLLYEAWPIRGERIHCTLVTDDSIYAVVNGVLSNQFKLVRIPFTGEAPTSLDVFPRFEPVGEPCLADGNLYIATRLNGVLVIPLDGGEIHHLDESAGLVNKGVESFACVGEKLYIALADRSILLAYDLKTRQSRVIASGSRKEAHSPLDNLSLPFRIPFMMADPAGGRVVFATTLHDEAYGGLWKIDAATDEITRLLPLACSVKSFGEYRNHHLLLHTSCVFSGMYESIWSPAGVIDFDLGTDKSTLLAAFDWRYAGPTVEFPETQIRIGTGLQGVLLADDGKLWFRQSTNELAILSQANKIPDIIPAAPEYCGACGAWEKLRLLDNGQIAAINPCGIWLLDLPPTPAPPAVTKIAEPPTLPATNGELSLEIESFKLTNGSIEPRSDASGGKVVRLDPMTGRAFQKVSLPAGRYEFMLYASCSRLDEIGARLQFDFEYSDQDHNTRLNCDKANQMTVWHKSHPPGPVIHDMKSAGQLKLLLSARRSDILLDRLVIRPMLNNSKDSP